MKLADFLDRVRRNRTGVLTGRAERGAHLKCGSHQRTKARRRAKNKRARIARRASR